jgi:carbon monoxide dehydrogenase subunit G
MQIEESLIVPVHPDALWPWLSTPERLAEWITDVQSFESRPAGELEVGSQLVARLPHGVPIEASVERADRGHALVLRASGLPKDLEVLVTFLVREQEGQSALLLRAETQLTGMLKFAESLIAGRARAKVKSWADNLIRAVGRSPG